MFKTKILKIIFFVILGTSLFVNVLLVIATKNMSDTQNAIMSCAKYAQATTNEKGGSTTSRKVEMDRIYDACLKTRYGIDQKI